MAGRGGGDGEMAKAAEETVGGFEWDADSQLFFHASTGFYYDPFAGWYYSSRDGEYYMYENGNYVPLATPAVCEASQLLQDNTSGLEENALSEGSGSQHRPSEWLEETLINMYLSGYSNIEVNPNSSPRDLQPNGEERSQTCPEEEPGNIALDELPGCLDDNTSQQTEIEKHHENILDVHEQSDKFSGEANFSSEEESWLSQYGQVERTNDSLPSFLTVDLWDWEMVPEPVSNGHPMARLVGSLVKHSSKLHPSLPARRGLLRTAAIREVHLDLVRVTSGKVYRLRNPSRKYLASLSAFDASNPTKDWGFPDLYANLESNVLESSDAQFGSEVADGSGIMHVPLAGVGKVPKIPAYRDRAAERRILHGGYGIGPGQKGGTDCEFCEETRPDSDANEVAAESMNSCSGISSARRIMESMGWKEGEALGKSRKGVLEPLQAVGNKGFAGLGWNQTRQDF